MPWRDWNNDDDLLLDLGDVLRSDRCEEKLLETARQIHAWRTADLDRALAALLYDSSVDDLAAVRGPVAGAPRSLVFALGELRVEIELSENGIEGQLIPPEPGRVRLLDPAGPVAETDADEVGCFTFPPGPRGPMRIECAVAGRRLATEWITV